MLPKFARNIGVGIILHLWHPPCSMSPRRGADAHGDALGITGGTVMRLGHRSTHVVLASAIATLAITSLTSAQERAGVVTTLEGKVTVVRASSSELTPLKFRDAVFVRDRITTDKDSFARVLLGGKAVVTIREFSAVTITEVPGVATVDVGSGRVAVAVARERMRPGDLVEVRTPNAVAGIRGTVIVAEVFDAQRSVITVLKGVIDVTRLDAGRAAGPGAASIASNPQLLKWFDSFRDTIKDLREAQREAQREQRRNTR